MPVSMRDRVVFWSPTCQIATPFPQNSCQPHIALLCRPLRMARKRRADSNNSSSTPMTAPRRRSTLRDLQASATDGDVIIPKVIDARPSLEKAEMYGIDDPRPASSRMMALAGRIFIETIPQWLAIGAMLGLIFGGCCSNVSKCPIGCGTQFWNWE
jgi:hypothetical protein